MNAKEASEQALKSMLRQPLIKRILKEIEQSAYNGEAKTVITIERTRSYVTVSGNDYKNIRTPLEALGYNVDVRISKVEPYLLHITGEDKIGKPYYVVNLHISWDFKTIKHDLQKALSAKS